MIFAASLAPKFGLPLICPARCVLVITGELFRIAPFFLHVELRVRVHRHAGARRLLYVHLRHAIGRADDVRRMGARRDDLRIGKHGRKSKQGERGKDRVTHREKRNVPNRVQPAGFRSSSLALCNCRFRDGDKHSPELAEHKPITTFIHGFLFLCPRRNPFVYFAAVFLQSHTLNEKRCAIN
jgi:hypothetical protein